MMYVVCCDAQGQSEITNTSRGSFLRKEERGKNNCKTCNVVVTTANKCYRYSIHVTLCGHGEDC
jgi:hypothetical protein